jgi:hypothetical protein
MLCAEEYHDYKPVLISKMTNKILIEVNNMLEKSEDTFNEIQRRQDKYKKLFLRELR